MLLSGCKLTAVEARDCGLVTDVFPHDKFTEEVQNWIQATAKLPPPPQGRKLNCRISQQGAPYNGVAVAFGDMPLEGGGVGGKGFICNLLEIFSAIWLLSINCRQKSGSKTSVFLPERYSSFMFSRIMGPAKVHWLASNFSWNLSINYGVKEHILSYCHNLWNYTVNSSSSSLVQWNVAFWMQTDSSWSKRLWIGYRCFLPWQVHRRSSEQNTSNGQATPPPR